MIFGITAGTLLPRIPALKENLHLTDGDVGAALLALAVGAVLGAGLGRAALKLGARTLVRVVLAGVCLTLILPAVAPSLVAFAAAFGVQGLLVGMLDLLINSQAAEIERDAGRPMINGFHAFWSLGSIVGSIVAAAAAALAISPVAHFAAVALALTLLSVPLLSRLPDTRGGAAVLVPGGTARWRMGTAVAVVAALAFFGIVVESGGADWSAVYLHDFGGAPQDVAALGFAALSVAMTVVRFTADRLTAMTSARMVAGFGGLVGGLGFGLAVAVPAPLVSIVGFALVGAGAAVMVPLAFSAGANLDRAGNALGIVTAAGYAGSIVGPPLIGAAADHIGLRLALVIPAAGGFAVLVMMASTRVLSKRTLRRLADATEGLESEA